MTRFSMPRRSVRAAVLLGVVPCALFLTGQAPPPEPEDGCPDTWPWTTSLLHFVPGRLPGEGLVRLTFIPPHYLTWRQTRYYGRYTPSDIFPLFEPDGSVWQAQGDYWAQCPTVMRGNPYNWVTVVLPQYFEGTVTMIVPPRPPPDEDCEGDPARDPPEEMLCDDPSGGGGGSGGSGDGGTGGGSGGGGFWGCIEISYDGGITWEVWWCGWVEEEA